MKQYYGYVGQILFVDLTNRRVRREPLDFDVAQKYIGGMGVNYYLLSHLLKPDTHPLSPENPIIIGVGPFHGTLVPASGKVVATMKFPVPGSKTEEKYVVCTACGGSRRFGAMIKNAGYDHVVITGRAEKPSYLKIIDDDVEICDASDLWGKDIYETTDVLAYRHKGKTGLAGVWVIGRAGENLLVGAWGVVDKHSSMGRWGGGAVLGSKNLKAIVTLGTKGVRVADEHRFMDLVNWKTADITAHPAYHTGFPSGQTNLPGTSTSFATKNYPTDMFEKTMYYKTACMSCIDSCRTVHKIKGGRFDGETYQTGHFVGIALYGLHWGLKDYREAIKLFDLVNRAGVDALDARKYFDWVTRLFERGVISTKETGGLVLKSGDFNSYAQLLEKWINRQDIGEAMAQGWYRLSEAVGVDASSDPEGWAIIKGDVQIQDPRRSRFSPTSGLSLLVRPRAQHMHGPTYFPFGGDLHRDTYWPEYKRSLKDVRRHAVEKIVVYPEEIDRIFTRDDFNVGRLEKHLEDAHGVYDSLGMCDSGPHWDWDAGQDVPLFAELYSALTGFEVSPRELKKKGERVWNMERLLNVREGFTREDDRIPELWLRAAETPYEFPRGSGRSSYLEDWFGQRVTKEQIEQWLDDYFDERGWDIKTGVPTKAKLQALGLDEFMGIVEPYLK